MNNDFDLKRVGKRMPYTVPDGFFAEMERNVLEKAGCAPLSRHTAKPHPALRWLLYGTSVAAVAVLLFRLAPASSDAGDRCDFAAVEQAFDGLCEADRTGLLNTYEDDTFINDTF